MLVAPLMTPILGLGLASLTGDQRLLKDATSALLRGALVAVAIAALLTLINRPLPFITLQDLPHEVLMRTRPTPMDLFIALAGGVAAAFALAMPDISPSLPGVAIATALMPPLCTVGIGLALGRWNVVGGALLLFVTNAVAIAFAAMTVFYLLGFGHPTAWALPRRARDLPRSLRLSALLVALLFFPLAWLSAQFVQQANAVRQVQEVVRAEVARMGGELTDLQSYEQGGTLHLVITLRTLRPLRYQDSVVLQERIAARLQRPVAIVVNQTLAARLDPLVPPTPTPTPTATFTATPGPSPTPSPTWTPTVTPTATPSPTLTPSPTWTPSPTPTPAWAVIANTQGRGVKLRQWPNGPVIGVLWEGAPIRVLYGMEITGGLVWIEVQDAEGRIGWLPQMYTFVVTLTPSPTPTITLTPTASPTP